MSTMSTIRSAPSGFKHILKNIGPGIVVSGSVVGSGELLVTTRMGAEVGFIFLWGVILACIVKFFIQLELGRQAIIGNSSTIDILNKVAGVRFVGISWIVWICVIGFFAVMLSLIGILGSVSGLMATIFPFGSEKIWAVSVFLIMTALLWRGLYSDLETMVMVLVTGFSLIVIGSVFVLQWTPYAISPGDILSGLTFELPAEGAFVALALMGAVGTTATELFMYPYLIQEKGYPDFVGKQDDSPEWEERYKGWMRVVKVDALVCMAIALSITCAYYVLGASVLAENNIIPQGMRVVEQVSLIFTETIGSWAYYIFMLGGFCTLFSSLLVVAAAAARIAVDFLRKAEVKPILDEVGKARWVRILQIFFPFVWLLFILVNPGALELVLKGANINNILLLPLSYAVLHVSMKTIGKARMSVGYEISLLITIWAILTFTVVNLSRM